MRKSLIIRLHKEHSRIVRKGINSHKNIPLPPKRANPSWTNRVHIKQFIGLRGHHLGDQGMRSSNHFPMMTRVADRIFLKFQFEQSLDEV
jgi:hypothetical protein